MKRGSKVAAAAHATAVAKLMALAGQKDRMVDSSPTPEWFAKHAYPLLPDEGIDLISLTGQDYPHLREAFGAAWDALQPKDRKSLLGGWRDSSGSSHRYPRVPWIVAIPFWPSREEGEFGLTHPSGDSIRFIAPLIEIMPEKLAKGVVARELGYAWALRRCQPYNNPYWASRPRQTWAASLEPEVGLFETSAGFLDNELSEKLVAWVRRPEIAAVAQQLETDAVRFYDAVGEDMGHVYS